LCLLQQPVDSGEIAVQELKRAFLPDADGSVPDRRPVRDESGGGTWYSTVTGKCSAVYRLDHSAIRTDLWIRSIPREPVDMLATGAGGDVRNTTGEVAARVAGAKLILREGGLTHTHGVVLRLESLQTSLQLFEACLSMLEFV
jgi:hypothetical protein